MSRTRLAVEIGIGAAQAEPNSAAVAINVARYAAANDLPVMSSDLEALHKLASGCSVRLAGLAASVMSRGLAYDSDAGTSAAAEICELAKKAIGAVTADHASPAAIRWIAAESSGSDPVDLLLAHEDEQTPELSECVNAALNTTASKTEAEDVRLRILGARTLDQIDGLERARLEGRGLTEDALDRVEQALKEGLSLSAAFSRWVVGDDLIRKPTTRMVKPCSAPLASQRARSTRRELQCRVAAVPSPTRNRPSPGSSPVLMA